MSAGRDQLEYGHHGGGPVWWWVRKCCWCGEWKPVDGGDFEEIDSENCCGPCAEDYRRPLPKPERRVSLMMRGWPFTAGVKR